MQLVNGQPCVSITLVPRMDHFGTPDPTHLCFLARPEPGFSEYPAKKGLNLTMIHQTCRQLYQETSTLLYSEPVFSLRYSPVTLDWLRSLHPIQRQAVRRLRMSPRQIAKFPLQQAEFPGVKVIQVWSWERAATADRWSENGVTILYKKSNSSRDEDSEVSL